MMCNGIFITDQHRWSVSQSNAILQRQRLAATAGMWFYLCVHAWVSQPHVMTPLPHLPFPLSVSLCHLFPLSFFMLHCVHEWNTERYTSFCIYHTCTRSLLAQHKTEAVIWFAFLSREADRLSIWNEIRSRGRLSLKIGSAQACARINLGYILLSCRSRSVSIPNRIQSPLNKNKRSFLFSLRIFPPSSSYWNPNTGIIRFLHSWLINLLIMHGSQSNAHWCFCVSPYSMSLAPVLPSG